MSKRTDIFPRLNKGPATVLFGKPQEKIGGDLAEADVIADVRWETINEEPPGTVLVICPYEIAKGRFTELLAEGRFVLDRVKFIIPCLVEKDIHVPAVKSHTVEMRDGNNEVVSKTEVLAAPATTKKQTMEFRLHLGTQRMMFEVKEAITEIKAKTVVYLEPNEQEGDLEYLPQLIEQCPRTDFVIYHAPSEQWGVVVTGDTDNWEDEFPALADVKHEKQEVIVDNMIIKGNVHVVAAPPESFKTMGMIEVSSAILDERPVFDLLAVNSRHPIMFLCADMSPVQLDEWAAPFNLRKHGDDFRVMRGGAGIPKVDDPVLQKAVRGRILILDTMLDFARIQKAFESGEWTKFMDNLRGLMNIHGCVAVIMTAHSTRAEVKSESDNINKGEYFKDSVTFHGKTDIGFGCKVLKGTSQVKWERIKGRGFKYRNFSFTVAVHDEAGNSNLDKGRFPVFTRPEDMKELKEERKAQAASRGGRKPNPEKNLFAEKIRELKAQGKTIPEIAEQLEISESSVKRWGAPPQPFDSPQEEGNE